MVGFGAGHKVKCFHAIDQAAESMTRAVIEDAFDRKLRQDYFSEQPVKLFATEEWNGVAIVKKFNGLYCLDKLAVKKEWQHNSVAKVLLRAVFKEFPSIFWRAAPRNPINFWYFKECGGCIKDRQWNVFWKGVRGKEIDAVVHFAMQHESDFV